MSAVPRREIRRDLDKAGTQLLEAPDEVPHGTRIVARHPDPSVFEYMRLRACPSAPGTTAVLRGRHLAG
ncbi:hypothetical protein ACWD3G_37305, partial [Streptomyces sp. NPDC002692]